MPAMPPLDSTERATSRSQLNWINIAFIAVAHLLAVLAVVYMATVHFSPATLVLAACWYLACGMAITGGYHRLFAHKSYRAAWPLRLAYLCFGAGAVQNSALRWAADHRVHHAHCDEELDPYNIRRGFWWAHLGWVFVNRPGQEDQSGVQDLAADPLVAFQHRHFVALAFLFAAAIPGVIAAAWGDAIGGVLVAGILRLVVQWHATFSVNSFAHCVGSRPYSRETTARDSVLTALISLGEGYHNFHHRFQADYRNGVKAYHFDPTKWLVWSLAKVGVTWDLKRTPREAIERSRQAVASTPTG